MTTLLKNAVDDFAAVGDGITNNDAAFAAIVTYINTNGGTVFFPRGIYVFNSTIPTITANGSGFVGEGRGTSGGSGSIGSTYGTVFRHNGTSGNSITLSRTTDFTIQDICFWPIKHKTSGSEIYNSNRAYQSRFIGLFFWDCYTAITSDAAVFATYQDCGAQDCFDSTFILTGDDADGRHLEGAIFTNCTDYHSAPVYEPESTQSFGSWSPNHGYTVAQNVVANGFIWQCRSSGTSGSVGPVFSNLILSTDRTIPVQDNSVSWRFLGRAYSASVYVKQCVYHLTVQNCKFLTGWSAISVNDAANSGTSLSRYLTFIDLECDHQFSDVMYFNAGDVIQINDCTLEASNIGNGIHFASGCKGIVDVSDTYIFGNGQNGIRVESNVKFVSIKGNKIAGSGRQSANTYNGITVDPGVTNFNISDNTSRELNVTNGIGASQTYGIKIGASCDQFIVNNNDVSANVTGGINNLAGTSVSKICQNNIGSVVGSSPVLGLSNANRQVFLSSGTYTPTPGTAFCDIELVGAGGNGGSGTGAAAAGAGGGAGGYARKIFPVVAVGTAQIVVGTAGSFSKVISASGSTILSATGGSPGANANTSNGAFGGAGGIGSNGDVNVTGGSGQSAGILQIGFGGTGGASFFGSGGSGGIPSLGSQAGIAAGSGGGGGQGGGAGSSGAPGIVIITEYAAV